MNFFLNIFKLLPPEVSHTLALKSLNILYRTNLLKLFYKPVKTHDFNLLGLNFKNKLGVAAGLDKNGDYIDSLGSLGFGFIEVGTVTPLAQAGNSKPRMFRAFEDDAIINKLGFNNKGVDYLVNRLKKRNYKGIIGVNIGANKSSTGDKRIEDYLICLRKVFNHCDYIAVNISSPNTPQLRDLHSSDNIKELLDAIEHEYAKLGTFKPIFLKISPDESHETIENISNLIESSLLSGLIVSNTTLDKSSLDKSKKNLEGGVSGAPLMKKSTEMIEKISAKHPSMPIIGVGGVLKKDDFLKKIEFGASLVQIYSGFIIKGPKIVNEILQ